MNYGLEAGSRAAQPPEQERPAACGKSQVTGLPNFNSTPISCDPESGWTVHEYPVVDSTNFVASHFPAWHAVVAGTQTAGRGRFQRRWVSDQGGLWLSAVVPAPAPIHLSTDPPIPASCLPLVAGLALCEMLQELGVTELRMRWPNDVLVRDRKLAGLLLDQFVPDRIVVGIGLNVFNQPETFDPSLGNQTVRLMELLPHPPQLTEIASQTLRHLRRVVRVFLSTGFSTLLPRVNGLWGPPRRVELSLDDGVRQGLFTSVDQDGALLLKEDSGYLRGWKPAQVRHLRECPLEDLTT
jgi:BirA family biotin operon repressor/biotin-[acetyl-CoA-carboxylase] ligase